MKAGNALYEDVKLLEGFDMMMTASKIGDVEESKKEFYKCGMKFVLQELKPETLDATFKEVTFFFVSVFELFQYLIILQQKKTVKTYPKTKKTSNSTKITTILNNIEKIDHKTGILPELTGEDKENDKLSLFLEKQDEILQNQEEIKIDLRRIEKKIDKLPTTKAKTTNIENPEKFKEIKRNFAEANNNAAEIIKELDAFKNKTKKSRLQRSTVFSRLLFYSGFFLLSFAIVSPKLTIIPKIRHQHRTQCHKECRREKENL